MMYDVRRTLMCAMSLCALALGCNEPEQDPQMRDCETEGERQGELVCMNGTWTRQPASDQGQGRVDQGTSMNPEDMPADLSSPRDGGTSPDQGAQQDSGTPDMPAPRCDEPAVLAPHDDERVMQGDSYSVSPQLSAGQVTRWRKSYGPDAVSVNATTGELTWDVPAGLPSESFHVGVRGEDACGGFVEDVWVVTVGDGAIARMGAGAEFEFIHEAMASVGSGGTVIIEPGYYEADGFKNSLSSSSDPRPIPPPGTPSAYTTLIAAEPGQSVFSSGIFFDSKFGDVEYIAIKGLHTQRGVGMNKSFDDNPRPHHVKFVDIISEETIGFLQSDDILVEGAVVFGGSRYKLSAYKSSRVIFRRTVFRMDHAAIRGQQSPYGGAIAYSSDDIVFQNVLDLNSNLSEAYPVGEATGSFAVPTTAGASNRIIYERCMSIDNVLKWGSYDNTNGAADVTYRDVVGWDIETVSGLPDFSHGFGNGTYDHATFGEISTEGDIGIVNAFFNGWTGEDEIRNTFFSAIDGPLFYNIEKLSYLAFHDASNYEANGAEHQPDTFMDIANRGDALEHLPRVKPGGPLEGTGSDGKDIGARVMTFVGRSGTFHGEPGWDEETGISMWPYPNEELIAQKMRAYSYDGPVDDGARDVSVSGDRGFAAEGTALYGGPQTLTSYVWEYLGNPCPLEICAP